MAAQLPSLTHKWHNTTYPAISPSQPHLSVKGKSILITGGGRGIGARTARSFAAAGASLISITGRTASTLESTKTAIEAEFPATKFMIAVGDVTDEAAMESAFAELSKASGGKGVDICVHNAGYMADVNSIVEADMKDWWAGFTIDVLGSFVVTRTFLKYKNTSLGADEPVLVVLTTGAIVMPPIAKYSSYGVSKFAQARFFEAVVNEEKGFRLMQVHPGVVVTDMGQKSLEGGLELPLDDGEFAYSD
jgi:NAD(P)-dependent dehydrogenase (short-subunit alcohol dehydrogenase family)